MYHVEHTVSGERVAEQFETAEKAMTAINRLSFVNSRRLIIRDREGRQITERQLAMIVMEERFQAERGGAP